MNLTLTNLTWTERMDAANQSSQAGTRWGRYYSFLYFKELDKMIMMVMVMTCHDYGSYML